MRQDNTFLGHVVDLSDLFSPSGSISFIPKPGSLFVVISKCLEHLAAVRLTSGEAFSLHGDVGWLGPTR